MIWLLIFLLILSFVEQRNGLLLKATSQYNILNTEEAKNTILFFVHQMLSTAHRLY